MESQQPATPLAHGPETTSHLEWGFRTLTVPLKHGADCHPVSVHVHVGPGPLSYSRTCSQVRTGWVLEFEVLAHAELLFARIAQLRAVRRAIQDLQSHQPVVRTDYRPTDQKRQSPKPYSFTLDYNEVLIDLSETRSTR